MEQIVIGLCRETRQATAEKLTERLILLFAIDLLTIMPVSI
jgi:hypothetical protein